MASLPEDRVYQGVWIDQTRGQVCGATITMTSARANLVIAVLSLLVSFAGSHLWDLIAFTRYWLGVSHHHHRPETALHRQLQILLRNITSPGAFVLETLKVTWAWRNAGALRELLIIQPLALTCSAGFLAAGIFISQLVSTSQLTVLASSSSCGWLSWRNETTTQGKDYQLLVFNQARSYMDTCYNSSSQSAQCNAFVQTSIPIDESDKVQCPFPDLCANDTALRLDTGLLDSNQVFGINTPAPLRVQMQRTITCAPLDLRNFSTLRPLPIEYAQRYMGRQTLPGEQLYEWHLGNLTGADLQGMQTYDQGSYDLIYVRTFRVTPRSRYIGRNDPRAKFGYNSTFSPIPELQRDDADTHLTGIRTNGVQFNRPNDDPIFAAHKPNRIALDDGTNRTMYTSDQPTSFLGCAEQRRFCFPQGGCTPLTGFNEAYEKGRALAPTPQQEYMVHYFSLQMPTMYYTSSTPMLTNSNGNPFVNQIPPDQWKNELRSWFRFHLAVLQTTITHIAAGPGIVRSDFDQIAKPVEWPGWCHSQRMAAPDGFSNVNVLGLVLTVSVSSSIIVANLTILPSVKLLNRRNVFNLPHIKSWVQDGMLQVLRKTYEATDQVEWLRLEADVPITRETPLTPAMANRPYAHRPSVQSVGSDIAKPLLH